MKHGSHGVWPVFTKDKWWSKDLCQIEHIAPQTKSCNGAWDADLYKDEVFHRIGNLTLLPEEINISASNKGWPEKLLYYQHMAESDPERLKSLQNEALTKNVELKPKTISLLAECSFAKHIEPIVAVSNSGTWNRSLVEARTERICKVFWNCLARLLTLEPVPLDEVNNPSGSASSGKS